MPLGFDTLNQGRVAFGFFHVESDLLLLRNLFFFAPDFCGLMTELAQAGPGAEAKLPGWRIDDPEALGDLHGAIAGRILTGFIGALYARYPFPASQDLFKQKPRGLLGRAQVEELLASFGRPWDLPARRHRRRSGMDLEAYVFDGPGSAALVEYIVRGGMPGWLDDRPPEYVKLMADRLARAGWPEPSGD